MHSERQLELEFVRLTERRQWQAFGLVAACLLAVVSAFSESFVEMVRIWHRSGTFTHGFLVLPAFLYLVWQRRADLAATPVRPFLPALVLVAGAGFLWLLGEVASALTPSMFGAVAMVPAVVIGVFGWRWARVLAFPLAFLFFAVPFGEAFVPKLMEWTADFTVLALQATGVPVLREGQHLFIPTGRWSVVEACSGIRYLIASMFVGALYAWMMYRSPVRRTLFFVASIVVPIVANWMRAYIIVMLGHLSGNRIAAGVDHLIYGWVFFGAVIMILFAVGTLWREDHHGKAEGASPAGMPAIAGSALVNNSVGMAAVLMAAMVLAWPAAGAVLIRPYDERVLPAARFATAAGWRVVDARFDGWRPKLHAAASEQTFIFEKDGQKVGLFVGFFRNQRQGAELVNSENVLLSRDDKSWVVLGSGLRSTSLNGDPLTVKMQRMRAGRFTVAAWQWYWLGDSWTSSDSRAKLELAFDRMLRRDDTSAWIAAFVVEPADGRSADAILDGFVREMGGPIERALRAVAGR
jgi:exosortase A